MIDTIQRNRSYFTDKMLKEDKTIYSQDLDDQFNDVSDYLDKELKPSIDQLTSDAVKGVAGNIGAFLHNVGDGTTDWQSLDQDKLDDFSIPFAKIVKINSGSVVISDKDGALEANTPNDDNLLLVSRNNDTPIWQQITSNQIEPKTLTSKQLGILAMENFVENQFITNIVPNVITTTNIKDKNITNDKIMDGQITSDHLGIFHNLPTVTTGLTVANIDDGAIMPDKIQDGTIPITYRRRDNSDYQDIWGNVYGMTTGDGGWVYQQLLKSENIKDNSIEDERMAKTRLLTNDKPQEERFEASKGFFENVPYGFQFTSEHLTDNVLDLDSFDDEVKAAFNRL